MAYDTTTKREDLLDIIKNISPTSSPLQATLSSSTHLGASSGVTVSLATGLGNHIQVYDSEFGIQREKTQLTRREDVGNLLEALFYGRSEG